jgi:ABC-2 type transport system permease protein
MRAIFVKEQRLYRRNGSIVAAMAIIPMVFVIQPLVAVFATSSGAAESLRQHHELLYMLAIPALVPATLASYAVVGERQEGTLEPVLSTPIRREELLLAKALAVLVPAVVVAYLVFGAFIVLVELFAKPHVASGIIRGPDVLAQVIFTPLLAGLSIWIAIGISTRSRDVRVAQQLATLASLPSIAVTTLVALDVIHPTVRLAFAFGIGLLVANRVGWRVLSALFDRERLISAR